MAWPDPPDTSGATFGSGSCAFLRGARLLCAHGSQTGDDREDIGWGDRRLDIPAAPAD